MGTTDEPNPDDKDNAPGEGNPSGASKEANDKQQLEAATTAIEEKQKAEALQAATAESNLAQKQKELADVEAKAAENGMDQSGPLAALPKVAENKADQLKQQKARVEALLDKDRRERERCLPATPKPLPIKMKPLDMKTLLPLCSRHHLGECDLEVRNGVVQRKVKPAQAQPVSNGSDSNAQNSPKGASVDLPSSPASE